MILVDTHVVIWLALAPVQLSAKANAAIKTARKAGGLAISNVTLWELAMLDSRKRIELLTSLEGFLHEVESSFVVLSITAAIAVKSLHFGERYPKDPMDRIIGATAVMNGMSLITRDEKIRDSKEVSCIW